MVPVRSWTSSFSFRSFGDVLDGAQEDQHRLATVLESLRKLKHRLGDLTLVLHGVEGNPLLGPHSLEELRPRLRVAVRRNPITAVAGPRCGRERHDAKPPKVPAPLLLRFNGGDQFLKGRLQMRFVMNQESVLSKKSRVQRPGLESPSVAAEQQPAADHVHRSNDHRGPGWVVPPLRVVGEFSAKRADTDEVISLGSTQTLEPGSDRIKVRAPVFPKPPSETLGFSGGLIDNDPAIYNPYQPSWKRYAIKASTSLVGEGEQPHNHGRGLPAPGGQIKGTPNLASAELEEQVLLPSKRLRVSSEGYIRCPEELRRTDRCHRLDCKAKSIRCDSEKRTSFFPLHFQVQPTQAAEVWEQIRLPPPFIR